MAFMEFLVVKTNKNASIPSDTVNYTIEPCFGVACRCNGTGGVGGGGGGCVPNQTQHLN